VSRLGEDDIVVGLEMASWAWGTAPVWSMVSPARVGDDGGA
jgi:hypothetical protein